MKKFVCILLVMLAGVRLWAQEEEKEGDWFNRHNVSFYGMGGVSTLLYGTALGENSQFGLGGGGGIGYGFNFIPQFGMYIGAEVLTVRSKFVTTTPISEKTAIADYSRSIQHNITSIKAQQNAMMLNVPLVMQLTFRLSANYQFYGAGGVKFGLAFFENTSTTISGNTTIDGATNFESLGFDPTLTQGIKFKFDYNFNLSFTAEAGLRRRITDALYLYFGLWADYGIFNVRPEGSSVLLVENSDAQVIATNDFFTSKYINDEPITNTFGFGGKLRFDIDFQNIYQKIYKPWKEQRADARRAAEAKNVIPDLDTRLVMSVRDALSQRVLPAEVMITNRAKVVGENPDSIVTEVDKGVYRLRMKANGDYTAVANVDVPPDIKKILVSQPDSADAAAQPADKSAQVEKGSARLRLMLRDMQSGMSIRSSTVKVLDGKTLMFVDVLARPNDDGSVSMTLPAEFNGYITFHIGGRALASYTEPQPTDKTDAKEDGNSDKSGKASSSRMRVVRRSSATTAAHQPTVRRIITPAGSGAAVSAASTGGIGGIVDYLNRTFSDYTLRVRRFFVGGQARHQIEIQATQ